MFKGQGIIKYDPRNKASAFLPWTCIVQTDESVTAYYRHWIRKALKINVNRPIWLSHVTVVRGEEPKNKAVWKKYHGQVIHFEYDPEFQIGSKYFWLPVYCPVLSDIRVELGLTPLPRVPFHCTIANTKNVTQRKERKEIYVTFPWEQ